MEQGCKTSGESDPRTESGTQGFSTCARNDPIVAPSDRAGGINPTPEQEEEIAIFLENFYQTAERIRDMIDEEEDAFGINGDIRCKTKQLRVFLELSRNFPLPDYVRANLRATQDFIARLVGRRITYENILAILHGDYANVYVGLYLDLILVEKYAQFLDLQPSLEGKDEADEKRRILSFMRLTAVLSPDQFWERQGKIKTLEERYGIVISSEDERVLYIVSGIETRVVAINDCISRRDLEGVRSAFKELENFLTAVKAERG